MSALRRAVDEVFFAEGPRWHDDQLWFSDLHGQCVYRTSGSGPKTEVLRFDDDVPSGLGWRPDGRMLVVAMHTQQVRRLEPDGSVVVHIDLGGVARGILNDLVVGHDGTAYVGDMGFDLFAESPTYGPGQLFVVSHAGETIATVTDLMAPNGVAITDDRRVLVVAESGAARLTAFDIAGDGSLDNRRVFADLAALAPMAPDGICLDAEGAAWVADPIGRRVLRVLEGGDVTDSLPFDEVPAACVTGGPDRAELFICIARHWERAAALQAPTGHIDSMSITVPGGGRP